MATSPNGRMAAPNFSLLDAPRNPIYCAKCGDLFDRIAGHSKETAKEDDQEREGPCPTVRSRDIDLNRSGPKG